MLASMKESDAPSIADQAPRRLDAYLASAGLVPSRARAQEAIAAGLVSVNGAVITKPAQKIAARDHVELHGTAHPFVSRGGVKLAAALDAFKIDPAGKTCLDLGASTGGFCDVLLRRAAAKIFAVDVGQGQLHSTIAEDARVVNLEKTHARDISPDIIREPIELVVCDVSFISLKKALPVVLTLAVEGAFLAALVKPQFEVGPENIGKGGIVRPGRENAEGVAENIAAWLTEEYGWCILGIIDSPISGGDGNREFLIGAQKTT